MTSSGGIREMFSRLAPRYDVFNRLSSLGLDNLWRRALVRRLEPGWEVLDLGCGTGDLTLLAAAHGCRPTGLDFSPDMLAVARKRAPALSWVESSADKVPLRDGQFSAVVSAYVMRNLYRGGLLDASLREAFRLLKPGGNLTFLDLTRPENPLLRWGHGVYLKTALPMIGRLSCGDRWPGSYLKTSIEALPPEDALRKSFSAAGFADFKIVPLSGGIVSLFIAEKK